MAGVILLLQTILCLLDIKIFTTSHHGIMINLSFCSLFNDQITLGSLWHDDAFFLDKVEHLLRFLCNDPLCFCMHNFSNKMFKSDNDAP